MPASIPVVLLLNNTFIEIENLFILLHQLNHLTGKDLSERNIFGRIDK
jgi:hypothetical protein